MERGRAGCCHTVQSRVGFGGVSGDLEELSKQGSALISVRRTQLGVEPREGPVREREATGGLRAWGWSRSGLHLPVSSGTKGVKPEPRKTSPHAQLRSLGSPSFLPCGATGLT